MKKSPVKLMMFSIMVLLSITLFACSSTQPITSAMGVELEASCDIWE